MTFQEKIYPQVDLFSIQTWSQKMIYDRNKSIVQYFKIILYSTCFHTTNGWIHPRLPILQSLLFEIGSLKLCLRATQNLRSSWRNTQESVAASALP